MSLLAEIFVARDDEAVAYDTSPDQFTDRAEYKSFTPLELSTLWCIMRDVEWDVDSLDEFPCLFEIDGGERLIHSLPSAMVMDLAAMPLDRIPTVTAAWAATDEMDCKPEEVRPIVEGLIRLARLAKESGRGLHLWNSV